VFYKALVRLSYQADPFPLPCLFSPTFSLARSLAMA